MNPFPNDPARIQSTQNFQRVEIDLSLTGTQYDLFQMRDGRRYRDVTFDGDSIYVPPESAAYAVQVQANDASGAKTHELPLMYPGGNSALRYSKARIIVPSEANAPAGTVIIILSKNMGFSSGSVLINAASGSPANQFISPFAPLIVAGTDDAVTFPVSANSWASGDFSSQADNADVGYSVCITSRSAAPSTTYLYYTFANSNAAPAYSFETYGMLLPESQIVVTPPSGKKFLHVYSEAGASIINVAVGRGS